MRLLINGAVALVAGLDLSGLAALKASETITYKYDALGRLVASSTTGTINNGVTTATTFDSAGNRTNYAVNGATAATAALSISNTSAPEGSALVFVVTRSGLTTSAVTVAYATGNGTAQAGVDYTAATGTLSFAAGETSKTVTIATIDDSIVEGTETILIELSAPTNATISDSQGAGSIVDNDQGPNNPPIATADTATTSRFLAALIPVLANDSDPDGDTLSITAVSGAGFVKAPAIPTNVRFNPPGPAGTYVGTYTISDGKGGTATAQITVTVTGGFGT